VTESKSHSLPAALADAFLGGSPSWYKRTVLLFLVVNPVLFAVAPKLAGWALVLEFIFTLAMALRCYPLQPGGLLAFEAVVIGMVTPERVYEETLHGIEVVLLLIFMVAGIYFLKQLLLFVFTNVLVKVRSKVLLSLLFTGIAAVLSAFLDALTVTAVVVTVAAGFYGVYHKVASGKTFNQDHDSSDDGPVQELHREDLLAFRAFLRSLVMHAVVGTALGGVMTLVGEPQNLLIASVAEWEFLEFFVRMAPVSLPVFVAGLITCVFLEKVRWFGYGVQLPAAVRSVLEDFDRAEEANRTPRDRAVLVVQGCVAVFLVLGLAFHLAPAVGLIGLAVIVLATAFAGVTEEHQIGHAFTEALPFTALLVVFFTIVGVIHEQELFAPVVHWVLTLPHEVQPAMFYVANGVLSAISDNVFVATVYIDEVDAAFEAAQITRAQFDALAVAINTGTNLPSVATPNGQAAFLFLLTSALAPLIGLSYLRMVVMALPYTIVLTITGLLAVVLFI
jgi:NhaB family Na+:H+ antiporter